jgi:hypothetical protein
MVTYANLSQHPHVAPSLIGMPLAAFDLLYAEFAEAHRERLCHEKLTRRTKTVRQRTVGAGRKHRYDLRDRLLMTLFWMRTCATYEVLGFFYELDKTNIEDNLKDVLATLDRVETFTFERPNVTRLRLGSPEAIKEAFPELCQLTDINERSAHWPRKDESGGAAIPEGLQGEQREEPWVSSSTHVSL